MDLVDPDARAIQERPGGGKALVGKGSAVPNGAVTLFLVIADKADPVVARHLHQGGTAIMPGGTDTEKPDRLTAPQLFGHGSTALLRMGAVGGMKATTASIGAQDWSRHRLGDPAKPGMCWAILADLDRHD